MKAIGIALFIFVMIVFISSCKKLWPLNATFHGRITYECNGAPVQGMEVDIYRHFDTGREGSSKVGTAVTDNNGYYSLETKVKQEGSFRYYGLVTTARIDPKPPYFIIQGKSDEFYIDDDNVEMSTTITSYRMICFHIKNQNPFDNNDILYGVDQVSDQWHHTSTILGDEFLGSDVDTILVGFAYGDTVAIEYQYRKNNIFYTDAETIITACNDTVFVDLYY